MKMAEIWSNKTFEWMDDLRFCILFNSISVISGVVLNLGK